MAASPLDRCKYLVSSRQASGLNTPRPGSSAPGGGGGGRFRSLCFSGTSSLLARLSLYVADELLCLADDLVDNLLRLGARLLHRLDVCACGLLCGGSLGLRGSGGLGLGDAASGYFG
jgi:hypothetical protein